MRLDVCRCRKREPRGLAPVISDMSDTPVLNDPHRICEPINHIAYEQVMLDNSFLKLTKT
jgi:hypothetical protein